MKKKDFTPQETIAGLSLMLDALVQGKDKASEKSFKSATMLINRELKKAVAKLD